MWPLKPEETLNMKTSYQYFTNMEGEEWVLFSIPSSQERYFNGKNCINLKFQLAYQLPHTHLMHPELTTKFREERGFNNLILLLSFTLKPRFQKTQIIWMVPKPKKTTWLGSALLLSLLPFLMPGYFVDFLLLSQHWSWRMSAQASQSLTAINREGEQVFHNTQVVNSSIIQIMTAADKKRTVCPDSLSHLRDGTILCMSKSDQTPSTALSQALPRNEVRSSLARASLTANLLILPPAQDLKGKK